MSDYTRVYFEGLGIDFDVPSVAFTIGSYSIHCFRFCTCRSLRRQNGL